jgi:hypothetical protein
MINRRELIYSGNEIVSDILVDVDWDEVKYHREKVLEKSDWRFLSDQTPTQEWTDYRQFLRDLPQNYSDPNLAADAWNEYPIPE